MLTDLQILETAINKMFEIAGHPITFEDIAKRQDAWYTEYTMTKKQNQEWLKWLGKFLKKERRHLTENSAKYQASMLNLNYGLKVSDYESV